MKKLILLFVLAATMLVGCHGSEEPAGPQVVASIVTFDGTDADGISTFSYSNNDGDSIRLFATWTCPDSQLKVGNRALIYYYADEYGVSSYIQLSAVMGIPTGKAELAAASDIRSGQPLQQARIWRSGRWLNLAAIVNFSGNAKNIDLLVEASTADQPSPQAFIVIEAEADSRPAASRQVYASWLIDDVLYRPGCDSLTVNFTAPNNVLKSITITK